MRLANADINIVNALKGYYQVHLIGLSITVYMASVINDNIYLKS